MLFKYTQYVVVIFITFVALQFILHNIYFFTLLNI